MQVQNENSFNYLDINSLFALRLVSRANCRSVSSVIGTNPELLRQICRRVLQQGSQSAVENFIAAFGRIHAGSNKTAFTLHIETSQGPVSQESIDLLAVHFPNITKAIFCRSGDYRVVEGLLDFDFYPAVPATVTEVEIDDEEFFGLSTVIKRANKLEKLILKRVRPELEEEVVGISLPQSFKSLEIQVLHAELAENSRETAISLHYKALRSKDRKEAIALLERSIKLLPRFILPKLQLSFDLQDDFRSMMLLREVIQDDPENCVALSLISKLFQRRGEEAEAALYIDKAYKIAARKNDFVALLQLAQVTGSIEVVERVYKSLDRKMPKSTLQQFLFGLLRAGSEHVYIALELALLDKKFTAQAIALCIEQGKLAPFIALTDVVGRHPELFSHVARVFGQGTLQRLRTRNMEWEEVVSLLESVKEESEPYMRFTVHRLIHQGGTTILQNIHQHLMKKNRFPEVQKLIECYFS